MAAIMVVHMDIDDPSWIEAYFAAVPQILARHGAVSIAGGRQIRQIEGDGPIPQRIAILSFPSLEAIDQFMADEDYQPFKAARLAGTRSDIFVFANGVSGGALV